MQNKSVQIPYELFFQLLQYFLMDNYDGEEIIRLGLEKKLDAMVKYKANPKQHQRKKKEKSSGRNIWTDGEYRRTFDGKGSF